MTSLMQMVQDMNSVTYGCSQDELDDLALMLDRLEELEIFYNAPSISEHEKQDTMIEMQALMDRIDHYVEKA